MTDGIINVYKEKGFTSHDVVAKLRGILKQKKIGHTGTLDPDAQGVLPVCLGKATKVVDMLTDSKKEYVAGLLLGRTTDTQDITGNVLSQCTVNVAEGQVREAVLSFIGTYDQIPPMYSACKVDGKRLYEYARAGMEVERKSRPVTIYGIEILDMCLPVVRLRVVCSKGTYIRTLCHDIGEKLGCGGCMESLLRTKAAGFALEDAKRLDDIEQYAKDGRILEIVQPIDSVFTSYPRYTAKAAYGHYLYNGNRLQTDWLDEKYGQEEYARIYDEHGRFIGVYHFEKRRNDLKPEKIFWHKE